MALGLCLGLTAPAMAAVSPAAYPFTQDILVDGEPVTFNTYALRDEYGNYTNYVKLRDVAYALNGTCAQFAVEWDGSVNIIPGAAYTPNGTEMAVSFTGEQPYLRNPTPVRINGGDADLDALVLTDAGGGGYTYFKLRDLGAALGFVVDWTQETGITIDTEPAEAGPVLANGKPITEENILEILYGLRADYPEGMRWTNENSYYSAALRQTGYGCHGFALICSDAVFGDLPLARTHTDFDAIRVGDFIRVNGDTHTVVVLEKRADSIVVTEGNFNSSIHWGRELSRQSLISGNFVVSTRYPE